MSSQAKSEFAILCRALRVEKNLKQREVAAQIEVKPGTYGNVESSPHKVIRRDKAERLASFYGLDEPARARLLSAWDRCPLSPYGEKQRATWEARNKLRSKARHYNTIKAFLVEMIGLFLMEVEHCCSCDFGSPQCVFCGALEAVGLPSGPATGADRDRLLAGLAKIQGQLATPAVAP